MLLPVMMLLSAMPAIETFNADGFGDTKVSGVWYAPGEAAGGIPLGGFGTGFVELNSDGRFGATTMENDWLKPRPVTPGSGFIIKVGDKTLDLTDPATKVNSRMWGHWPMADVVFDDFKTGDGESVDVSLRAFSPVIPGLDDLAGLPTLLFHFKLASTTPGMGTPKDCSVALRWKPKTGLDAATPIPYEEKDAYCAITLPVTGGSYGVGASNSSSTVRAIVAADGALEVEASGRMSPNKPLEFMLALSWNFPEWTSSDGETLRHHYAPRGSVGNGMCILSSTAVKREQRVVDWQRKIYGADAPPALKDACINGLYILARNTWWLDDGRFFQSESFTGCPITETFVCRFYGSFPLALMWPELEKASMREIAKHQAENGQIPFGFGTPMGTKTPMMNLQIPIVSTEFALTTWRNYHLWKDGAYLKEAYPAAKKALQFAMTLDTDGDGLVNEAPGSEEGFPANQYYDIWPWWGTSAYVGGISLAAWRAGEEMAKVQGDEEFAKEMRERFERGAKAYDDKLWTGSYYRLYSGDAKHPASDTSLTNALCGQWFAYASGLGEILPREKIAATIDTVFRLNVPASPYGMVNGVKPDGTPDTSFKDHSAVLTIGELWCFTAMAAHEGHRKDDAIKLFNTSYENIALNQKTPWNIPWSLDPATGAIKWGIHYYSNPCVWTLLSSLSADGGLSGNS
ncbi:MAG: GH116 family glycosyl hydrolase [FCB group bacterium]|jgi:non-lysosomal glucosylceramidase|nr:GH116 family glycosyl hydrolase [FCB group bacterium]